MQPTHRQFLMCTRQVGDLPKEDRGLTPVRFATWLIEQVRRRTGCVRVAVLYCDMRGPYIGMTDVHCYPVLAEYYTGPYPVICHPPCEAWGRFRWKARTDRKFTGLVAIDQVHQFGGVIEHPWRSRLFIEHWQPGGRVQTVDQSAFGHACRKRTDLYWTV